MQTYNPFSVEPVFALPPAAGLDFSDALQKGGLNSQLNSLVHLLVNELFVTLENQEKWPAGEYTTGAISAGEGQLSVQVQKLLHLLNNHADSHALKDGKNMDFFWDLVQERWKTPGKYSVVSSMLRTARLCIELPTMFDYKKWFKNLSQHHKVNLNAIHKSMGDTRDTLLEILVKGLTDKDEETQQYARILYTSLTHELVTTLHDLKNGPLTQVRASNLNHFVQMHEKIKWMLSPHKQEQQHLFKSLLLDTLLEQIFFTTPFHEVHGELSPAETTYLTSMIWSILRSSSTGDISGLSHTGNEPPMSQSRTEFVETCQAVSSIMKHVADSIIGDDALDVFLSNTAKRRLSPTQTALFLILTHHFVSNPHTKVEPFLPLLDDYVSEQQNDVDTQVSIMKSFVLAVIVFRKQKASVGVVSEYIKSLILKHIRIPLSLMDSAYSLDTTATRTLIHSMDNLISSQDTPLILLESLKRSIQSILAEIERVTPTHDEATETPKSLLLSWQNNISTRLTESKIHIQTLQTLDTALESINPFEREVIIPASLEMMILFEKSIFKDRFVPLLLSLSNNDTRAQVLLNCLIEGGHLPQTVIKGVIGTSFHDELELKADAKGWTRRVKSRLMELRDDNVSLLLAGLNSLLTVIKKSNRWKCGRPSLKSLMEWDIGLQSFKGVDMVQSVITQHEWEVCEMMIDQSAKSNKDEPIYMIIGNMNSDWQIVFVLSLLKRCSSSNSGLACLELVPTIMECSMKRHLFPQLYQDVYAVDLITMHLIDNIHSSNIQELSLTLVLAVVNNDTLNAPLRKLLRRVGFLYDTWAFFRNPPSNELLINIREMVDKVQILELTPTIDEWVDWEFASTSSRQLASHQITNYLFRDTYIQNIMYNLSSDSMQGDPVHHMLTRITSRVLMNYKTEYDLDGIVVTIMKLVGMKSEPSVENLESNKWWLVNALEQSLGELRRGLAPAKTENLINTSIDRFVYLCLGLPLSSLGLTNSEITQLLDCLERHVDSRGLYSTATGKISFEIVNLCVESIENMLQRAPNVLAAAITSYALDTNRTVFTSIVALRNKCIQPSMDDVSQFLIMFLNQDIETYVSSSLRLLIRVYETSTVNNMVSLPVLPFSAQTNPALLQCIAVSLINIITNMDATRDNSWSTIPSKILIYLHIFDSIHDSFTQNDTLLFATSCLNCIMASLMNLLLKLDVLVHPSHLSSGDEEQTVNSNLITWLDRRRRQPFQKQSKQQLDDKYLLTVLTKLILGIGHAFPALVLQWFLPKDEAQSHETPMKLFKISLFLWVMTSMEDGSLLQKMIQNAWMELVAASLRCYVWMLRIVRGGDNIKSSLLKELRWFIAQLLKQRTENEAVQVIETYLTLADMSLLNQHDPGLLAFGHDMVDDSDSRTSQEMVERLRYNFQTQIARSDSRV